MNLLHVFLPSALVLSLLTGPAARPAREGEDTNAVRMLKKLGRKE